MGSKHPSRKKKTGLKKLVRLVTFGLVTAAVVKELRTPQPERTWHGQVAGFVPYDFRVPTPARLRERVWSPQSEHLMSPNVFGVGWTLNVGRLFALARHKAAPTD